MSIVPVEEIALTENARRFSSVAISRRDEEGNVLEKPEDMLWRVARNIASAETQYNKLADVEAVADRVL